MNLMQIIIVIKSDNTKRKLVLVFCVSTQHNRRLEMGKSDMDLLSHEPTYNRILANRHK